MFSKQIEHPFFQTETKNTDYPDLLFSNNQSLEKYQQLMKQTTDEVVKHFTEKKTPFSGISVAELRQKIAQIDFNTIHPNIESLLAEVKDIYTNHAISFHLPTYIAHLNCPVTTPALAAEVMISALNSSLDTWDQSAGGTLIEQRLINWTANLLGLPADSDGVFTSGGTQSNLMGLLLARDYYLREYRNHDVTQQGLPDYANRFRIFVSEAGHFSVQKNAALLGLGHQAVVVVKSDRFFRMNSVLLEDAIQQELAQGNIPIAVVGTAGTTDFSSIDPLKTIGQIAKQYQLWFHVDAAYGCGLLLSDQYRHRLQGIELADTITVDYHKSFFQPVSSSAFLMRDKQYVNLITYHADYLNPKEHEHSGYPNQVNKSLQTTRRFDALKLWFSLRMLGKDKMGKWFEQCMHTAKQAASAIKEDSAFQLLNYPDISAVVFRYHPKGLSYKTINNINEYIKNSLFREGKAYVAGTKVKGEYYLKFTILNPATTLQDIYNILDLIKQHGQHYSRLN